MDVAVVDEANEDIVDDTEMVGFVAVPPARPPSAFVTELEELDDELST
jgi:hypothetical protein